MAGTSRGFIKTIIGGIRVAGDHTKNAVVYYPAHSKNGVNVNQRCTIRGCVNIPSKMKGGEDKKVYLTFTAWNKLADVCAKSMSPGKEFDVLDAGFNQYEGTVYIRNAAGQNVPVTIQTPQGQVVVKTTKIGYKIEEIRFGAESEKFIASQNRPAGWNVTGSPANLAFKEALKQWNDTAYDPAKPLFGFAKVVKVEGPGIGAFDPNQKPVYNRGVVAQAGGTLEAQVIGATAAATAAAGMPEAPAGVVVKGL